jgi:glyoxylase I family protein
MSTVCFDPAMQALKLAWLGTRTPDHDATVAFFRDVLGMRTELAEPDFTVLALPDGGHVEVFGPRSEHNHHFTHPVAGFLVDDIVAAEAELRAAGIEIVQPLRGGASAGWVHFRGPDGHLYELTRDPGQL